MPLPTNSSVFLHNQAVDAVQTKPKHAIFVRLSPEALEALADPSHPRMDFEFGDEPGIYIGDQFFPMKRQSEDIRHELYLRAATAARPNPPLKHYATITGKLEVTRRIGQSLRDKLHKIADEAAEQHSSRKTKFIDTPPDIAPVPSRKKKEQSTSGMFMKPVRHADHSIPRPPPAAPASTPPTRKDGVASMRTRLIHYVAIADRTSEEVVRALGGTDCDATRRREILDLLDELAERIPSPGKKPGEKADSSKCKWRLKVESWLDVRPYEWPRLSDADRTNMARSARKACSHLRIPEADPVWNHFRFRAPPGTVPAPTPESSKPAPASAPPESSTVPPKRGVSSKDVRPSKKTKAPKVEIQIKDESRPLPPKPSTSGFSTPEARSMPSTAAARKPPGSGYKLSRTPSQDLTPNAAPSKGVDPRLKDIVKKTTTVGEPERRRDRPSDKERVKVEPHESDRETVKRREKERPKPDVDLDREAAKRAERRLESKLESSTKRDSDSGTLKRKKVPVADDYDNTPSTSSSSMQIKKRKIEESANAVRHSLPRKPVMDAPKPIHKEPSPLPPPRPSQGATSKASKSQNGASRQRRKSPIYTSSEDEGREAVPLPTPPTTTPSSRHTFASDRASLRATYRKKYMEQLESFREVCMLKQRIEELLEKNSSGTITDSEGDIEMWDVNAVATKYEGVREELQHIRQIYDKAIKT